jgi:hypothetical protein
VFLHIADYALTDDESILSEFNGRLENCRPRKLSVSSVQGFISLQARRDGCGEKSVRVILAW